MSDAFVLGRESSPPERRSDGRSILAWVRLRRGRKPDVARLRSRGDLSGLRAVSRHRDLIWDRDDRPIDLGAPVRVEAVEALTEFYGPEVVEALYEAIADPSASVRRAAAAGLLELDSPAAAAALIAALVDWPEGYDPALRSEAARGLAAMGASGLPEAYAARLVDSGRPASTPFDGRVLEALLEADGRGQAARSALIDFLVSRLENPEGESAAVAEGLLEGIVADSVEALLRCLADGRSRISAARLLGASRDVRAVDPLVRMLGDPDPEARATAALSLGELKHAGAVEALLHATRDDEYRVRDAAMSALDAMGAAGVTVGLAAMVESMQLSLGSSDLAGGQTELAAGSTEGTDGLRPRQRRELLPWAERVLDRLLGPGPGGP